MCEIVDMTDRSATTPHTKCSGILSSKMSRFWLENEGFQLKNAGFQLKNEEFHPWLVQAGLGGSVLGPD